MKRCQIRLLIIAVAIALAVQAPAAEAGALFGAARSAIAKRALKPPLKAVQPQAVQRIPGKPHDVIIHRAKHPEAARHIEHAQRGGQPTVLHVERAGAAGRRVAAIKSVNPKRKPAPRYERDEYPPAFTREGGHNANVRFINPRDNRGAGATMGAQTRGLPNGAKIRVLVTD